MEAIRNSENGQVRGRKMKQGKFREEGRGREEKQEVRKERK